MNEDNAIRFQSEKPVVDTQKLFRITVEEDVEGEYLRVENKNVNLLYYNLTDKLFFDAYNFLNKYLDFNFSPVLIDGQENVLSNKEQGYLEQIAITRSIYFYSVNRVKITLKPGKISLKIPFDAFLSLLDKKYGIDSQKSVLVGAHVLRTPPEIFRDSVIQRRQYYNK